MGLFHRLLLSSFLFVFLGAKREPSINTKSGLRENFFQNFLHAEYNRLPYAKFVYRLIAHKNMVAFKFGLSCKILNHSSLFFALNFLESLTPFSNSDVQRGRSDVAGPDIHHHAHRPRKTAPPAVSSCFVYSDDKKTFFSLFNNSKTYAKILNYAG